MGECVNCHGRGFVPIFGCVDRIVDVCPLCEPKSNVDIEYPVESVDKIQQKFWTFKEQILKCIDNFEKELLISQEVLRAQREAYLEGLYKEQGGKK